MTTSFVESGESASPDTYQLAGLPLSSTDMGSWMDFVASALSDPVVVSNERPSTTPSSLATSTVPGATKTTPALRVCGDG